MVKKFTRKFTYNNYNYANYNYSNHKYSYNDMAVLRKQKDTYYDNTVLSFPQIYNFTIIPDLCNCIETFKKYHDTTV